MSFGETFIILTADISDTRRGLYVNARVRTVQHPLESAAYLTARLLTYCHCYSETLEFTRGLYDPKVPTLVEFNSVGDQILWVQVGLDDSKKLERSIRSHPTCRHAVYFETEEQIGRFCHQLRGSKTNWVQKVEFYKWDKIFVDSISKSLPTRPTWQLSFVDNSVYLDTGSQELSCILELLNIWDIYQESLLSAQ